MEEGVYEVPDKFHDFEVFVWTLVDSDDAKDGVPENLVMHDTCHFVIYFSKLRSVGSFPQDCSLHFYHKPMEEQRKPPNVSLYFLPYNIVGLSNTTTIHTT